MSVKNEFPIQLKEWNEYLADKKIIVSFDKIKELFQRYPASKTWCKEIYYQLNYFNKNPFKKKKRTIFIDSVKETVDLINIEIIEEITDKQDILKEFLVLISKKEKKWSKATELLVQHILNNYHIYTTKDDIKSEMWIYKEGIYVPQGKSEIKMILRDILQEWYSQYIYGLVMAKLEADTFIDINEFYNKENKNIIAVKNGLLNVLTRELTDFTPEKIFFNKLPVSYDPDASCPKIEKFLDEVLSKSQDKTLYYELGGFCLLDDYRFEKAAMFVGNGRNGKDKCLELIKRTLGIDNCCSIPLASLQPDSFVISELFNRRVNLAGDISGSDLKDMSMFKALTGRSLISAKRKFMRDVVFVNHAKLIFACNQLPMVYDMSKGFWDRWILLEFPYTFVNKNELESSEDKEKLKLKDENIINEITTSEELSGILNRFLEGLDRLIQNKDFSTTKGSEEIKNLWIRKSNSFIAFCMDNIKQDYEKRINKKELRRKYTEYCKEHKIMAKSDIVLKRVLQDDFGASEIQTNNEFGSDRERYWEGITWKL